MRREIPQKVDSQISPTENSGFQSAARFGTSLFRRTRSASLLGVTLSASAFGAAMPQHKAEAYLSVGPVLGTASSLPELINSKTLQASQNGVSALLTSVNPQVSDSIAPLQAANGWSASEAATPHTDAVFSIAPQLIAGFQLTGQANIKADSALISGVSDASISVEQSLANATTSSLLSDAIPQSFPAVDESTGRTLTRADAIASAQELMPAVNSTPQPQPSLNPALESATVPQIKLAQEGLPTAVTAAAEKIESVVHSVQRGENLTAIAAKYQVSPEEIAAANQISDPNVIEVQDSLVIPTAQAATEKTPLLLGSWVENTKTVSRAISQMGVASALLAPQRWPSAELASVQTGPSDSVQPARQADKIPQAYLSSGLSSASDTLATPRGLGISTPYVAGAAPTIIARRSTFPSIPSLELPSLSGADKFLPSSMGGGSQQYAWPTKGVFTSSYGWRWGRMHRGIDIAGPVGTPIVAAAAGVVVTAGWNSGGYGYVVEIQHPDGSFTRYAHNNTITTRVGAVVQQGEMIAEMGSTGRSTGPHCHFEIHRTGQGAVDPMAFLARG